jgi:tRNA1(Val) A37 N6-methylase TrmN6
MKNPKVFKNAIVLDVGAGTGILSIFAARAGAAHVYAVERSDTADLAIKIIEENNLGHKITVIKKEMEQLVLHKDIPMVDIIISEWMGFCLLYESMLDSVIWARDNFLKEGGKMFPEQA